jgi:arylsulfatase A
MAAWKTAPRSRAGTLLAALTVACATAGPEPAPARPPSFLVVLCDDLGWGDAGAGSDARIRTPHLDRLASQGLTLTDCYAAAPVCSPSRAGLLTGRSPSRAGIWDWIPDGHRMHLGASEVTLAEVLGEAGYDTCHVGKWHLNGELGSSAQPQPDEHGFAHWYSTQNNARPSHRDPVNFLDDGEPVGEQQGFACQLVAREALRWLERERDLARPFFLFVCFHEPHEPVASPDELVASYPEARTPDEAQYLANVTNLDRALGELVDGLDALGLGDETLVVFTSDNGPETLDRYPGAERSWGSPGGLRGMKLWLAEGGIRVPGIVRWPGRVRPGSVTSVPVSSVDLFPTLARLAGADVPADLELDGADLTAHLVLGEPVVRTTPLFWHYYRALDGAKAALREGRWKLLATWDPPVELSRGVLAEGHAAILRSARLGGFELYDLATDPQETRNVAAEHPEVAERLAARLAALHDEVVAEGPVW